MNTTCCKSLAVLFHFSILHTLMSATVRCCLKITDSIKSYGLYKCGRDFCFLPAFKYLHLPLGSFCLFGVMQSKSRQTAPIPERIVVQHIADKYFYKATIFVARFLF